AKISMATLSCRRASSSKTICFAINEISSRKIYAGRLWDNLEGLLDNREDVFFGQDQQLLVVDLDFGAGVLGEDHLVFDGYFHRHAFAGVIDPVVSDGLHAAFLRLIYG